MRSPRGVTLASVQLSSLPDASSPAPLPQQRERGNRRTHVLPLSPYVRPCVVISCQSIVSHAPIKTSHNWTLVSFRGQRGGSGLFPRFRGEDKITTKFELKFLTPSKSLLASGYYIIKFLKRIFSFSNFPFKTLLSHLFGKFNISELFNPPIFSSLSRKVDSLFCCAFLVRFLQIISHPFLSLIFERF